MYNREGRYWEKVEVITFQEIALLHLRRTVRTGAPPMRRWSWSIWPICYFQPAGVVRRQWRRGCQAVPTDKYSPILLLLHVISHSLNFSWLTLTQVAKSNLHTYNDSSAHRQIQSPPASSSCDFSQSQIFVTYSHTGRNKTLALVLIQRWRLQLRALALYFQSQVYFPCPRYYHSGNKMDRNWFQKKDSSTSSFS